MSKARLRARPLLLLVLFLGLSAALRLAETVGPALASLSVEPPTSAGPAPEALIEALQARDAELTKLESDYAKRDAVLLQAEAELERRFARLNAAREELLSLEASVRGRLDTVDARVAEDVQKLVSVFETMKPKEAAPLFEAMDPTFAAGFLARMKTGPAAEIMAGVSPEFAYQLSVLLAARSQPPGAVTGSR